VVVRAGLLSLGDRTGGGLMNTIINSHQVVRFEVFHGGDFEECRLLECYTV
jgi:hypothetical protein